MSSEEATNGDDISGKDQSKNNPYEPKEKPKLIRVLTVLAYILSVSMAAILLSVYYVFVWDAHPHLGSQIQPKPFDEELQEQYDTTPTITSYNHTTPLGIVAERLENPINFTTTSTTLASTIDLDITDEDLPERIVKRSLFMKKLLYKQHVNDILQDTMEHTKQQIFT